MRRTSLVDFLGDDQRDEITGYHEENVDADKPAAENPKSRMEQNDRQDGERPQTVYVFSVGHCPEPIVADLSPAYSASSWHKAQGAAWIRDPCWSDCAWYAPPMAGLPRKSRCEK